MLEQAGASARSKAVPALFGIQEELAPAGNQNVGEAFVSLFHQLMNRGRVSAPNPLDIQLGKSTLPAPVEAPVEMVKERAQVESAPEERVEEEPKEQVENQQGQNAALPEKQAKPVEQVETKAVQLETEVAAGEATKLQCVAANGAAKAEQVSLAAEQVVTQATEDAIFRAGPVQQQIAAKQAVSAVKSKKSEELMGAFQLPEEFADTTTTTVTPQVVAAQKGGESKGEHLDLLPEMNLTSGGEGESKFQPGLGMAREFTVAPKFPPATPVVAGPVLTVPKNQELLQSALRDWSKGSILSVSGAERRNDLGNPLSSALAQEKKAPAIKEGGQLGKKLEANQAKMLEQIHQLMEKAAQQRSGNSLTIKLDPVELGAMTVKVSQRADQVFARVQAENPEVERFLRENMGEIIQALAAAGIRGENVHVSIGREVSELEQFLAKSQLGSQEGERGSEMNQGRMQYQGSSEQGSTDGLLKEEGTTAESEAGWVA